VSNNPFVENPGGQPNPRQGFQSPQPKKSNSTLIIVLIAVMFIPMMCICTGLLLPAVQAAREAARRMSCNNNLKQISLGILNYEAAHGTFPPAYTVDAQGQPMHSWRTLILPFIEQKALYDQIDLTKPWDDPANQAAAQTAIEVYACPSMPGDPTLTPYVAILDPQGIMSGSAGSTLASITDGRASTILLTETDASRAVHWMSPQDIDLPTFLDVGGGQRSSSHVGGSHVLMGDGAVIFITDSMDTNMREALVTKAGNENIQL
jgi:hypothetical protein